jgi:hypothetical protein
VIPPTRSRGIEIVLRIGTGRIGHVETNQRLQWEKRCENEVRVVRTRTRMRQPNLCHEERIKTLQNTNNREYDSIDTQEEPTPMFLCSLSAWIRARPQSSCLIEPRAQWSDL